MSLANQDILNTILDKLQSRRKRYKITDIDIFWDTQAVRMNIDGKRFRIASLGWGGYGVEEIQGAILASNEDARKIKRILEK